VSLGLLVLVLVGSGLAAFLLIPRSQPTVMHPPPNSLVGHAFFVSSGQVSETSSQGINDELQIDLTGVRDPMAGKSFYAWLLPDQGMTLIPPVLLGKLHVNHGTVHFFYPGDKTHTNLLEMTSRFLVTEEDSDVAPNVPTPDQRAWLYYAAFPQPIPRSSADAAGTPTPDQMMGTPKPDQMGQMSQMGVLDHLRHLLSEAPELKSVGLTGGLDIWLFRNSEKVLQWAGEARDDWQTHNTPLLHRHLVRILQYLDGLGQVWRDAPGEPVLVRFNAGQIPLLDMNGQPQVHGFLFLIDLHLSALIQSSGSTSDQRTEAIRVDTAVKNVTLWLQKVYADAKQLVKKTPAQLIQPSSLGLLDDMHTQALYAFAGRLDPATGVVQEGVIQIHYNIQHLATFNIQSYSAHPQSGMGS
jgi:hypothetical protein